MFRKKERSFSTTQMIAMGFFAAIIIGSLLLILPISSRDGKATNYIDALFTATTSTCVTGLVTLNTLEHWSFFGEVVILFLIQFGGLGVVTFSTSILLILKRRITLKDRLLIQDAYNLDTLGGLVKLTIRVIKGTFIVEGIGAIFFSFQFIKDFGWVAGIWRSIFHSVSFFCNAGIDLMGSYSMEPYRGNPLINIVSMSLIILGGLGYPVWWDIVKQVKKNIKGHFGCKGLFSKLEVHSKLVIVITLILIFGGAGVILLLEYNNPKTLGELPWWEKIFASLFQSVTTRTAGCFTISQEYFTEATAFFSVVLMFIGGSPSGTAGGMKTVTMAILVIAVISILKGKEETEIFHRRISEGLVKKCLAVLMLYLSILISATMILSITEQKNFLDLLYEVVSALATVGLSRNVTPFLSNTGKVVIIVTMYIGRIGPISMALFFNTKQTKGKNRKFPEGKVIIG